MEKKKGLSLQTILTIAGLALVYLLAFLLDRIPGVPIMLTTVLRKGAIYSLVAVSMNLLNGFTGLFSLGQAGFMLVGAYAFAAINISSGIRSTVYQYYDPLLKFSLTETLQGALGNTAGTVLGVFISLLLAGLLAAVLAASLCACGEQQAADGGSLRLYCPADLSEQNKSAGGGDAVQGIAIPWADITAGDRGRQQQAQYIMELLLGGCTAEGFIAPIPVGTQLLSCTVTGGTVSVDMSSEYDQLIGIDRTIADYCITLSLMQLDGIYAVRLTVAGELPADRTSEVYTSEEVLLTSPDDVVRTVKVQLYFPDGGGTLVGEERRLTVYEGETVAQAVVKALTERPLDSYADLYPLLPEGFTALNASTEEGICYLNLPGSVAALLPEDAEAQNRMIQGLVDSLCSLEDVTQVQLMLDGEYQLMLGSVPISRPILPTGGVQPMAE